MEIGMANAAEENFDLDVLRTRRAARNSEWSEWFGRAMSGVSFGGESLRFRRTVGCSYLSCSFTHELFFS